MRHDIVIPQMGLMEDVVITAWAVEDGAVVTRGQTIVTVETDKVQADIEAPADGILTILVPAGQSRVPVEAILGYVTTAP